MNDLPEWLMAYLQDCRRLLGIGDDWYITAKMVDHPGGDEGNNGSVEADSRYLNARMEFARDLASDEEGHRVVLHEMLHIAHTEIDDLVGTIAGALMDAEAERFRELYNSAVDRFAQRVTRAMVRHIRPLEEQAGD